MAKAYGRDVVVNIGADYSELQQKLNDIKTLSKTAGSAAAEAFQGGLTFRQAAQLLESLAGSMARAKAGIQAMDADFKKAEAQLGAVAQAAGLSEKQFAGLAQQMARRTNLNNLERNLANIQRLTGASALQMARLRAEAGDTAGAIRGLASAAQTGIGRILTLKNAIVAGIVGAGFREFARITSAMTDLDSRLKLATGSAENAAAAFSRIHEVANRTYASLESTAEIFLSNSIAFRDLGYSAKQQLDFMAAMTDALVVSGVKGQQAESVINSLAKAMISGELRGRNFANVLQQGQRVVTALADGLGVTVKQLKGMAEAGELTAAQVFQAMTSQAEKLKSETEAMATTLNDVFVKLGNNYKNTVKIINGASDASSNLVKHIDYLADHLTEISVDIYKAFSYIYNGIVFDVAAIKLAVQQLMAVKKMVGELVTSLPTPDNLKKNWTEFEKEIEGAFKTWKDTMQGIADDLNSLGTRTQNAAKATKGLVDPANDAADAFRDLRGAMAGIAGADFGDNAEKAMQFLRDITKHARSAEKAAQDQRNADIEAAKAVIFRRALEARFSMDEEAIRNAERLKKELQEQIIYLGEIERGEIGLERASRRHGSAAREAEQAAKAEFRAKKLVVELEKEYADLTGHTREAQRKVLEAQINQWKEIARHIKDAEERAKAYGLIAEIAALKTEQIGDDAVSGLKRASKAWLEANTAAAKAGEMFNRTADAMTDAFTDIITGSKSVEDSFKHMATVIVNELARIAVQMSVVMPLIQGFQGMMGLNLPVGPGGAPAKGAAGPSTAKATSSGMTLGKPNAKGNVFTSPGLSAYSGSIVSKPTYFHFAKGGVFTENKVRAAQASLENSATVRAFRHGVGLMGEAGPEAIMPLQRDRRGRLGVSFAGDYAPEASPRVTLKQSIEIINQTGTPIQADIQTTQIGDAYQTRINLVRAVEDEMSNRIKTGQSRLTPTIEQRYGLNFARQKRLGS